MNLLIFFALPLATILLAIVFQKVLKCPILVAITFFAIYLIILFALYAAGVIINLAGGLIAVIIYTIIAFLTAWLVRLISFIKERLFNCDNNEGRSGGRNRERERTCGCNQNNETENNDLLRISCRCNNGNSQELLTINSDCLGASDDNSNGNSCGCSNNNDIAVARANNGVAVSGNVIPNQANCGRTGWIRGCYRRY